MKNIKKYLKQKFLFTEKKNFLKSLYFFVFKDIRKDILNHEK